MQKTENSKALAYKYFLNLTIPEEQKDLSIAVKKARTGLLNFIKFTKTDYEVNWHHELVCNEIDGFLKDPERKRLMLFVGPRRGKSEIVSRRLPAYAFGLDPDKQIIATSYGADLASSMNRDVQRIIDSTEYKLVFPDTFLNSRHVKHMSKGSYVRTSDNFEIVGHKGAYRSAGVGGGITGQGADLCFEAATKVLTKNGYTPISELKVGDWVWSFNHDTRKSELARVEAVRSRRVSDVVQVETSGGRKMLCTPNHPFWTEERGYTRAEYLKNDTVLIASGIPVSEKDDSNYKLLQLPQSIRKAEIRIREVFKKWKRRFLLRTNMFSCPPCCEEQTEVQNLWEACKEKDFRLLLKRLQAKSKNFKRYFVSCLQQKHKAVESHNKILFDDLQGLSPLHSNERQRESEVQRRNRQHLSSNISKDETFNKAEGQFSVYNLSASEEITYSSYRREQEEQQSEESHNTMSQLPYSAPQVYKDSISSVSEYSGDEVTVYDIQVERNHNFFAEDVLVHNCIIDDPLKDWKEAMSPVRKQAVYDWYTSTLYTRLSAEGKVIIVLTRWAEDDLAGRLLKEAEANPEADQWEVISLPEIFEGDNEHVHAMDPRSEGDLLWPSKYSAKNIAKVKASVGSKVWASLFQQQPTPGDGTTFKSQWFGYYKELPEFDYTMASWDCTFNDSSGSDFVAGTVWGVKGINKYLIYLVNERLSFTNTLKEILKTCVMFPDLRGTIIENKANGPAILSVIESKIPRILKYTPTDSKVARAEAVSPVFEAGQIFLPDMYYAKNRETMPWIAQLLPMFIDQFKAFPFGKNDDMVDSTVQFLLKDSSAPQWLQDLANQVDASAKSDKIVDAAVAELMGWDLDRIAAQNDPSSWHGKLGF